MPGSLTENLEFASNPADPLEDVYEESLSRCSGFLFYRCLCHADGDLGPVDDSFRSPADHQRGLSLDEGRETGLGDVEVL